MIISKNIRALAGGELKHFTVTQGACSDGRYIYMIFERKPKKDRTHRCKVVVYDPDKQKVVKVSGALKLGHGNDMCIRDSVLYVTHSEGKKVVHRVNATTLKRLKDVKVTIPKKYKGKGITAFNAICVYGSGYLLRVMGGRGMVVVNKSFKVTRFFKTATSYKTSQGMTMNGKTIVRAFSRLQSGDNRIVEYSVKGAEKNRSKVKLDGEMEAVFYHKGKRMATTYLVRGGKYEAYIAEV